MTDLFDGVAMENWDFPEAQGAKAKPRTIHVSESTCVNCE